MTLSRANHKLEARLLQALGFPEYLVAQQQRFKKLLHRALRQPALRGALDAPLPELCRVLVEHDLQLAGELWLVVLDNGDDSTKLTQLAATFLDAGIPADWADKAGT